MKDEQTAQSKTSEEYRREAEERLAELLRTKVIVIQRHAYQIEQKLNQAVG